MQLPHNTWHLTAGKRAQYRHPQINPYGLLCNLKVYVILIPSALLNKCEFVEICSSRINSLSLFKIKMKILFCALLKKVFIIIYFIIKNMFQFYIYTVYSLWTYKFQPLILTSSHREYYIFSRALVRVYFQWKFRKKIIPIQNFSVNETKSGQPNKRLIHWHFEN